APHRLSADRTGECYKSLPQEQRMDSVADGALPPPRSDAPAPPHHKVEVGIPSGLTTSVDKGNLSSSTPTPGCGQDPGRSSPEQAQVRAELALLIRWLSDRRPIAPLDGQDWAQHWASLAIFLESDWNEVEWQGIESREDGYLHALEGYWHRLRHARKRPQLYGPLAVPLALMDIELDSIRALAEAISSGDRSSELELAKRLTDRELQLKTEADEQHPCSTCPSPPESGLDQEGEGKRAAPPARTYVSLIRDLQHAQGYGTHGQAAVTDAAIRLAKASDSALDAQCAAATRKLVCLACFRTELDTFPTIRRLYERRSSELAAKTAAECLARSASDHDSYGHSPQPSVLRQDGEVKPATGKTSDNAGVASLTTVASDGQETARTEPVRSFSDITCPPAEDLDPARLAPPSAVGSSPAIVSASDPSSSTEKKSLQHEPSLLLFHSSPEPDKTGNRHSCSVDCGVPSGTQEEFENVRPVEEDFPPDIYAPSSPPSGASNFPDLLFGSILHHDILCLLSTRTNTTFSTGKKQGCTVNRSSPSPASIRLDVPAPVQATAHGSPSLLLSPSVAFAIGYVPASVTQQAPATIARTDSTGVSAPSVAGSWEQRASLAPAVSAKPRLKALQRLFLSAKAKRDSIQSSHLRPARQNIAFGSLFLDDDPQSRKLECATRSTAPSVFKGPLGSKTGGTSSSVAQSASTKNAPDKCFLRRGQPIGIKLSSAFTSSSTPLTPLGPTGPGPPSFGANRATSFPDGPSKATSGLHYACNRSTARGGRVSVDELGRSIVFKLHRTDIEQPRITTDSKHHDGIGMPKLPVAEQMRGGGPAMQQQRTGVSPMSLKVGRDLQVVKVYATVDTSKPPTESQPQSKVPCCPCINLQSKPPTESQPQCHSRAAASTAPPQAAANDGPRASGPAIGLNSREVLPGESQWKPRLATEAAEGAASASHLSCPSAVGHNHSDTKSCEPLLGPSAAANTSQVSRHSTADHSRGEPKSRGLSLSPAQQDGIESMRAVQDEAQQEGAQQEGAQQEGAQQEGAQQEGAQQEGARQEGAQQEGAQQEGAQQEGAETADVATHTIGTVTLHATPIVTTVRQRITRMQHDPGTDSSDPDTDIPLRLWRSQR
ncbi:unnamed protein product, partial [Tilletia laevis]